MKKTIFFALAACCFVTGSIMAQTINNVGPAYFPSVNFPFNSQLQTAQNNVLMFQGNNVAGTNAARNNLRVGIGVFPVAIGPVDRLHLHNLNAVDVRMRITNGATGATAADGFFASVLTSGDALLSQQENLSMRFNTNATQRMVILNTGLVGINTPTPTNQLEVNSSFGLCSSGVRLTQLGSGCPTTANPGPGVLAVDALGNIIYVPGGGGITGANNGLSVTGGNVQLGGTCGSGLGALTSTREIPMAGFNINHTMPAASPSQFNIGFPACTTIVSRFTVNNDFQQTAGAFLSLLASGGTVAGGAFRAQNTGPGSATGVTSSVFTTSGASNAIAVNARSTGGVGFNSFYNIGLNALTANASFASLSVNADITGSSSPLNQGLNVEIFSGTNPTANNSGASIIVSTPGNANFGVDARAVGATNNYGIYATVALNSGLTGAGLPPGPDYAGFFNGDVLITNMYGVSDRNLKKEIQEIKSPLDIIKKLQPVTYSFDRENHTNIALSDKKQYGFISQDVQTILPELTSPAVFPALYDSMGKVISPKEEYLALNYQGFIAIIVDAMQQQQEMIEAQQQQIDQLIALTQGQQYNPMPNNVNEQEVTLSNLEVVVLDQNSPNPFTNQTVINYYIPQDAGVAQIQFFDMNGKMIKVTGIEERGAGRLVVFAGDLRDGMYTYSLVVDGQVIDTKKMVKTE